MFCEVTYDEKNNTYQAIYKAKDERTAKWIADQYENVGLDSEIDGYIFAYKRDVVISSKSKEVANELRNRLNHELAAIMAGIQEIDSDYKVKKGISCEVNNIRLSRN